MPAATDGVAAQEAKVRGAKLALLHCVEIGPAPAVAISVPFGGGWSGPPPEFVESARAAALDLLRSAAAQIGVEAEAYVETGDAARAIVDTAEKVKAELVVIGTHGRTGLRRLLLGSVAEKVVRGAPCSVLVVRQPEG